MPTLSTTGRRVSRISNKIKGDYFHLPPRSRDKGKSLQRLGQQRRYAFLSLTNLTKTNTNSPKQQQKLNTEIDRRRNFWNGGYGPAHIRYGDLNGYVRLVWLLLLMLAR